MAYLKTFILDISPELQFLISLIDTKLVSIIVLKDSLHIDSKIWPIFIMIARNG